MRSRDIDDDEDDDARPVRRRDVGFRCPYCNSSVWPITRSQISTGGWIVFAVMLLVCFPLFFIGLLITEEYKVCADCGTRIGGA